MRWVGIGYILDGDTAVLDYAKAKRLTDTLPVGLLVRQCSAPIFPLLLMMTNNCHCNEIRRLMS